MRKTTSGFTIVELLIVIVVISILASISVVAFSGVQTRSRNASRANELTAWVKHFEIYKATYGEYPAMSNGLYCLGSGFPVGNGGVARCRDYNDETHEYSAPESGNIALMSELAKVGTLPQGIRSPVGGTVGPYVDYYDTELSMKIVINGTSDADCPGNTTGGWSDLVERKICYYILER